jgi:tetratricopeptide (TPR) repeat protein
MQRDTFAAAGASLILALVLCAKDPAFVTAASGRSQAALVAASQVSPIEQAVVTYRSGDRAQALASVLRWSEADIDAAVQTLSRTAFALAGTKYLADGTGLVDLEAALVLHTDAAALAAEYDLHPAMWSHLRAARRVLTLVDQVERRRGSAGFPRLPRLVAPRDWHLVALLVPARHMSIDELGTFAADAADRFPADAEIQLAAGCLDETRADFHYQVPSGIRAGPPIATWTDDHGATGEAAYWGGDRLKRRTQATPREEATHRFRAALAADPRCHEARVRLGRVLALSKQRKPALDLLAQAGRDAPDSRLRYLARIIAGSIFELEDRWSDADLVYREAIDILPGAQSARLALASLLERAGRRADAFAVVAPGLTPEASKALAADPMWTYRLGPPVDAVAILSRLRTAVRR